MEIFSVANYLSCQWLSSTHLCVTSKTLAHVAYMATIDLSTVQRLISEQAAVDAEARAVLQTESGEQNELIETPKA